MSDRLAIDGGRPVRRVALPLLRPSCGDLERAQVASVLDAGVFCSVMPGATKVRALEAAFARWAGTRHAVAFTSGTTAQHASLVALGIGPGDEVVVPPLTFVSTAYTVVLCGARAVFADVDEQTFNLDPAQARRRVGPRTRAIVPVHWFGHPADMDPLLELAGERGCAVIEDCAHAYGTTYRGRAAGTMGVMACWSLQESKLITAAGEGGMLTTDDDGLAARARSIRDHGKDPDLRPATGHYRVTSPGNNYRMTEIQAAFALAQLERIDELIARRRAHVAHLDAGLAGLPGLRRPGVHHGVTLSPAYYPLRFLSGAFSVDLERISAALGAEGIGNLAIARDELCTVHPLVACAPAAPATVPVAERIASELLILPLYPDLERADLDDVAAAVAKVVRACGV